MCPQGQKVGNYHCEMGKNPLQQQPHYLDCAQGPNRKIGIEKPGAAQKNSGEPVGFRTCFIRLFFLFLVLGDLRGV